MQVTNIMPRSNIAPSREESSPLQCNAAMQCYAMQMMHHIHIHIHITCLLQVVLVVNVASK